MKNKNESLPHLSSNLSLKSQETVYLHLQCYGKIKCNSKKKPLLVKAEEGDSDDDAGVRKVLTPLQKQQLAIALTKKKPVEDIYKIIVERKVSDERLKELGMEKWLRWRSGGSCSDFVDYLVDEELYILKGEMHVKPFESDRAAIFKAGDLVRFPKWMVASVDYIGEYEHKYRFLAYGDDN